MWVTFVSHFHCYVSEISIEGFQFPASLLFYYLHQNLSMPKYASNNYKILDREQSCESIENKIVSHSLQTTMCLCIKNVNLCKSFSICDTSMWIDFHISGWESLFCCSCPRSQTKAFNFLLHYSIVHTSIQQLRICETEGTLENSEAEK